MDYPCNVIRDLIPLCAEGALSPESEDAVLSHIRRCGECALVYAETQAEVRRQNRELAQLEKWGSLWMLKQLLESLWQHRGRIVKGLAVAAAVCILAVCCLYGWHALTQVDRVLVTPEDYRVEQVLQLEDGVVYCEYRVRYLSTFSHHYVVEDGNVYFPARRPLLDKTCGKDQMRLEKWKMDPDSVWDETARQYISVNAIYLGNPEEPEKAVLVWQRGMELPSPTPEKQAEIDGENWTIF